MSGRVEQVTFGAGRAVDTRAAAGTTGPAVLSAASLLAALATSSCCLLPFVLASVGISGAWIGNLTALAPYQPIFFALAVGFLGAGFYRVYRKPKAVACIPSTACTDPRADRVTKTVLWRATALMVAGIAFPWIFGLLIAT